MNESAAGAGEGHTRRIVEVLVHGPADSLRRRIARLRANGVLVLQCGSAAGLAWYVAQHVFGHEVPFFAPIAAVIVLGGSIGHRLRRTIELVVGVAVGILVGDLVILVIGNGALPLAAIVALAVAAALFFGSGALLVNQAGASAVLIATLYPPEGGLYYVRWIDALVGGAVAFVVSALLLPVNPLTAVRKTARPVLDTLATALDTAAQALTRHDEAIAKSMLATLRATEPALHSFEEALSGARETVTVSPIRWRAKGQLGLYLIAAPHIDHAMRNARVLGRRAIAALRNSETVPPALPLALVGITEAVRQLHQSLEQGQEPLTARRHAVEAIRQASLTYQARPDLSTTVVAAQVRSIALDVLLASGLDERAAHEALQDENERGR